MATGMLKFSPNNTVFIDLDLENHTANKAVDIDAEGVEWPLCGGGSGDFQIFIATLTNNTENYVHGLEFKFNNMIYKMPNILAGATVEIWLPVIGDEVIVDHGQYSNVTGAAVVNPDEPETGLIVTGDFAADVDNVIE